ncbi:MAG: FAD-binding protein [Cyanobacteriota bacterium]|nr:FAD-binding protein [Cyanobacteriota bacterium]
MTQATNKQKSHPTIGSRALVIGGSMAGLLAARVLTEHFDRVSIVESDLLPEDPETRPGVPQGNHVHVLLTQGKQIFEGLFPGLEAELAAAGAPLMDWGAECPWFGWWGWYPRFASNLNTRLCSRQLLESLIRSRLQRDGKVQFLERTKVTDLLADSSGSRVTGIKARSASGEERIEADFVVDASGRNSALPNWLASLGYEKPAESVVNSFLGYGSRWYEIPEGFQADWKVVVLWPRPPYSKRGGVIYSVEGNRWVLTLTGVAKDYPPTDEAAFLEFARSLRHPILYDPIKNARPLSPVYAYRRTENCWRHYEKLSKLPEGLVALGDAVCSFNPVYGQGMTAAALGAIALGDSLRQQHPSMEGFPQFFYRRLARVNSAPWLMATGEDLRWEGTEGAKPDFIARLMHRYLDSVLLLGTERPQVWEHFLKVIHMVEPPTSLFRPGILTQVLRQATVRSKPSEPACLEQSVPEFNG